MARTPADQNSCRLRLSSRELAAESHRASGVRGDDATAVRARAPWIICPTEVHVLSGKERR